MPTDTVVNSAQNPVEDKIILYLELPIINLPRKANYHSSDGGTALAANLVNKLHYDMNVSKTIFILNGTYTGRVT
jgi:hypothetical protein